MTIKSNYHWRYFLSGYEIPSGVRDSQFGYLDQEEFNCGTFLKYRGHYYSLDDFTTIDKEIQEDLCYWDCISADTFFSGMVIKISDCGEGYQIGYCYS